MKNTEKMTRKFSGGGRYYIRKVKQSDPPASNEAMVEAGILLPATWFWIFSPEEENWFGLMPELCFGDRVEIAGEALTHDWGLPAALDGEFIQGRLPEDGEYRQHCGYFSASNLRNAELLAELWITREFVILEDAIASRVKAFAEANKGR